MFPPTQTEPALATPGGLGVWSSVAVAAGIVAAIYGALLGELVHYWEVDPNYSHGFLVPLASLALAARSWRAGARPIRAQVPGPESTLGICLVAGGLLLHFWSAFVGIPLWNVVSLIFVIRGLLMLAGGREATGGFGFAAWFLIFTAPLPAAWYQPLAIFMQDVVSGVSNWFLSCIGIPIYREGYFLHLPGYTMEVGQACSGLRQLTAILALAMAMAYLSGRGLLVRFALVISSVPVAIAANCLRVIVSGLILIGFGRKWAAGTFHTLEGLAIVAVAVAMMLGVAWVLGRLDDATGGFGRGGDASPNGRLEHST